MIERDSSEAEAEVPGREVVEAEVPGREDVEVEAPGGEVEEPTPDDEQPQPPGEDAEQDPLALLEAERAEYLALAQRTQADFDNYRKRTAKDVVAARTRGRAELARELLPVIDNLERALAATGEQEASLAEGVRLVHSELAGVLERNGVEAIAPAGEVFDPNVHEALSTRAENGAEAGLVLDVVQKGYRLDGTVLRPARVVVSA